jgi:hypothetical protein
MNSWCRGVFAKSMALLLPLTADWLEWALTCPLSLITMNLRLSQCTCEMYSAGQRLLIGVPCATCASWTECPPSTVLCKRRVYKFDILLTVYHYVSQQRNQLNTLSLSQSPYCVLILYMFRASGVHLQEALH